MSVLILINAGAGALDDPLSLRITGKILPLLEFTVPSLQKSRMRVTLAHYCQPGDAVGSAAAKE